MAEGEVVRKFRCPGCRGIFRIDARDAGEVAHCTTCGTKLRLPGRPPPTPLPEPPSEPPPLPQLTHIAPQASTPPPLPGRGRERSRRDPISPSRSPRSRSRASHRRTGRTWGGDPDRWARTYALIWGIVLVAGVLVPAIEEQVTRHGFRHYETETKLVWISGEADAGEVISFVAALGLGVFAIYASRTLTGSFLGLALLWTAAGTFLLFFVITGSEAAIGPMSVGRDKAFAVVAMLLMLFGTPLIAAGNHLRKSAGRSSTPHVLAGVGGILLVIGFVLPVYDGNAMIELFFEERPWDMLTGIMLCLLGLFAYGVLGIVSFGAAPMEGLAAMLSILARVVMSLTVFVVVITLADAGNMDFGAVALNLLKVFAIIYGMLAILAVGLAAWLAPGLREADGKAESRSRPRERTRRAGRHRFRG